VQHYAISDGQIAQFPSGSASIPSYDWNIITKLQTNWFAISNGTTIQFPILLPWTSSKTLPTVGYWEIRNEVDGGFPANLFGCGTNVGPGTNYVSGTKDRHEAFTYR
jgi:hypothetical protein